MYILCLILWQTQHELKAVLDLIEPFPGQGTDFFFDAAFVNRFDLGDVNDAPAWKISFAFLEYLITWQLSELERRCNRQHDDSADFAVI
jgi:hypothetical protein